MRMYDILLHKRDGKQLSPEEINWFIENYTAGRIPDYQASALCMAIFFNGMDAQETAALTMAMARSGDRIDLGEFGALAADKHSTGGVGDKTTLVVAPVAAALGCKVVKLSGRGLGHTGGTIDKLESIPGFRTALSSEQVLAQVRRIGLCVAGQTDHLAPADKLLYALRDVTATVDSLPLIASSIMSKKLATGARCIVLDVKVGSGAFMKTLPEARQLARAMVEIGTQAGRRMAAVLTNMEHPLGNAVGNALEIAEAIAVLKGGGPAPLRELSLTLAADMAALSLDIPFKAALSRAEEALHSGAALTKLREMIEAQGGDPAVVEHPARLPQAAVKKMVYAGRDGYLSAIDAQEIGRACMLLGAGRAQKNDTVDPAAGMLLHAHPGDLIRSGDVLAALYTSREVLIPQAEAVLHGALTFSADQPTAQPLIYEHILPDRLMDS